ncbi:MAG: Ig-like domain repeat protein, partial [Kineosporiaceae bacterium]|nr:Ig-like domain repeat protein [Aeromicrobium sp.]
MKTPQKIAAAVVVGAVMLGSLGFAQAAQAAVVSGTITLTPSSGSIADDPFLSKLAVDQACPVGYQTASITSVVQGSKDFNISNMRTPTASNPAGVSGPVYGEWGFGTKSISMDRLGASTNLYVSNQPLAAAGLTDGNFELRVYCLTTSTGVNAAKSSSPYYSIALNQSNGSWSLAPVVAQPIATSTSLTASATGTSVALSATVKKSSDSSTATAAAGTVSFFEGATQVGTIQTVAAGLASVSLTGVANGAHAYTATFTPSDTVYLTSLSAAASVSVGALLAGLLTAAVPVGVTFDIAAGTNGGVLQLTSHDSIVALGTATVSGTTFNASGTLNAVVDDSRMAGSPDWNLTGVMADFMAPAVGTAPARTLSAKYLGWNPTVTPGSVGSAGAVVLPAPGSVAGLKTSSQLSYGSTSAADPQVTTTTVSALLQLKAPKNTAAGNYAGV